MCGTQAGAASVVEGEGVGLGWEECWTDFWVLLREDAGCTILSVGQVEMNFTSFYSCGRLPSSRVCCGRIPAHFPLFVVQEVVGFRINLFMLSVLKSYRVLEAPLKALPI